MLVKLFLMLVVLCSTIHPRHTPQYFSLIWLQGRKFKSNLREVSAPDMHFDYPFTHKNVHNLKSISTKMIIKDNRLR